MALHLLYQKSRCTILSLRKLKEVRWETQCHPLELWYVFNTHIFLHVGVFCFVYFALWFILFWFISGSDGYPAAGPQGGCRAEARVLRYDCQTTEWAPKRWRAKGQGERLLSIILISTLKDSYYHDRVFLAITVWLQCLQLESQCEQLQLKVRTLQLDWETEQKRSMSYFNQIMELEKERDQVSESRQPHKHSL